MTSVPLGELIRPAKVARAGNREYPLLSMTMYRGLVDQDSKFKKRIASQDTSAYKVIRSGQLVVGFPIDEGVLDFQSLYPEAIVSPAYGVWDLIHPDRVHAPYFKRFLRSNRALAYYKAKLRGSTARRRSLPAEIFLALRVPLPPLTEQHRIAAIVEQADALLTKRSQVLALLDALTKSIFHDMFGAPGTWPQRWPMGTIREMAESVQYGTAAKAGDEGRLPILRMGNLTDDGRLDTKDLKFIDLPESDVAKFTTQRGDLLFNRTNSLEKVGKSAVVRTEKPYAIAGYLVRVRFKHEHNPEFVSAYLSSDYGRSLRRGVAKLAVNQANISASELRRLPIALPPGDLQHEFASRLARVERQRDQVVKALDMGDGLLTSLQSRAFRGEL